MNEDSFNIHPPEKRTRMHYGYIIVAAAFVVMVMTWGTYYSFGIFFQPLLEEFGWTRALTSGAFSMGVALTGMLGILAGRLTDRFGSRAVMTTCGAFLGIGYILMSQVNTVWQIYLAYGVIIAVGMGGAWSPIVSTVARWFVGKRGMATGIAISGVGIGTLIFAPIASRLLILYEWRISYIVIGVICLVFIISAAQFLRRDPQQINMQPYGAAEVKSRTHMPEGAGVSFKEAVRTRQFWILCAIYFVFGYNQLMVMVHIVPHATGLGITTADAANILAIVGAGSIAGRVLIGFACDKIHVKPSFILALVMMSAAMVFLLTARDIWAFYLFATVFGFAYGGLSSLQSLATAELFGLTSVGVLVGNFSFNWTIGGAVGPVIAGFIFDAKHDYQLAFITGAVLVILGLLSSLLLTPLRKN